MVLPPLADPYGTGNEAGDVDLESEDEDDVSESEDGSEENGIDTSQSLQ